MPGFTHLQVAQPVTFGHHLLAYDAMLARDMRAARRCRQRVNRLPLGSAALAGTSFPIDRDARGARARLRGAVPELARRRLRSRLRDRVRGGGVARHDAPVALRRGARAVVVARASDSSRWPIASAPAARSCRRRRTPTCPSSCAARRAASSATCGADHADEGAAARVQQGQPGRQGAAVRHRRHARRHAGDHDRAGRRAASRSTPSACAQPRAKASRRRPTSPITSCAAACRSAMRTKPWHAPCAMRSRAACDLEDLPLAELRAVRAAGRRRRRAAC